MKRSKRTLISLICAAALMLPTLAAGTAEDPVVSQSYLEQVFSGQFLGEVGEATDEAVYDLEAEVLQDAAQKLAGDRLISESAFPVSVSGHGALYTAKDDRVVVAMGTKLTVNDGTMTASGFGLIDITSGIAVNDGKTLEIGHTYLSADDQSGFETLSLTGYVSYQGIYTRYRSGQTDYASRADALSVLGLFRGSTSGYELNRAANRTEALVMFLRILGLEDEALASTAVNPFRDIPDWADRYAAYAYAQGLIRGTGGDLYDAYSDVTARDYMTFLMRALGYQENVDFSWMNAVSDAVNLRVLNVGEQKLLQNEAFCRAQMVYLSWQAMMSQKSSHQLMLCALCDSGTVSFQQAAKAICSVVGERIS